MKDDQKEKRLAAEVVDVKPIPEEGIRKYIMIRPKRYSTKFSAAHK